MKSHNNLAAIISMQIDGELDMQWTKPSYTDLRIGFEVTMYFEHR
ncbi:hypothetical protein GCM10027155_06980 [Acinetobacter apis]